PNIVLHADHRKVPSGHRLRLCGAPHNRTPAIFIVCRGRSGNLIKIIWYDGLGMSLYAKWLEKGRFLWPSLADGTVSMSPAQLAYMLDGIDWRNPLHTFRRRRAG
ncbi:MAG: transposase, partial [Mesorhizobium sp.]|uniref:IS66 family insertion sequence element accessory protein TnpB n=1 Tax=Mesorhizobium sp. TaxID=1871066 RepID=UPI000FE94210